MYVFNCVSSNNFFVVSVFITEGGTRTHQDTIVSPSSTQDHVKALLWIVLTLIASSVLICWPHAVHGSVNKMWAPSQCHRVHWAQGRCSTDQGDNDHGTLRPLYWALSVN